MMLRCRKREWRSIQRKYPRNPNTEKLSLVWWTNCTILFRPSIQYILVLGLFFDSHCILSVVDCMAPIAMAQVQSTTLVQYILVSSLTTHNPLCRQIFLSMCTIENLLRFRSTTPLRFQYILVALSRDRLAHIVVTNPTSVSPSPQNGSNCTKEIVDGNNVILIQDGQWVTWVGLYVTLDHGC